MNIWKKIFKSKAGAVSLVTLSVLYLGIIFAAFFAPYNYDQDDVLNSYSPPTKIHLFNFSAKQFTPFVYGKKCVVNKYYQRIYSEDKSKIYPVKFFTKGFKYKLFGIWNCNRHLFGTDEGKIYLLGADLRGRDLFSRILYGGRISLSIVVVAGLISFSIGLLVGGISGYFGGKIDNFTMRVCEIIMMIPSFYLLLVLRSSFPVNWGSAQVYFMVVIILSLIGWASLARTIRGMALSLRENDFVYAAKSAGLGNFKIIIKHILPHTLSYSLVALVLSIPSYILAEAALSLIGLGIQEPQASWGNLLSSALGIVNIRLYPWILIPGIFIIITGMCFYILGDTLRDIFDPKRKIL